MGKQKEETAVAKPEKIPVSSNDREEFLDKIVDLTLRLLFTESIEELGAEIAGIIVRNFPVRSFMIQTRDEKSDLFKCSQIVGYPEDRIPAIKEKVRYSADEIKASLSTAEALGRFSRLFPAEGYTYIDERDRTETLFPEQMGMKRESPDSWHPLDRASFYFIDKTGKEIGYIYITSTTDGKKLDQNSIGGLDVLASIASVAIDLVRLRQEERILIERQERRTVQTSQMLTVASAILTLTETSTLIDRILELIDELFGFKAVCIALYSEPEKVYRWVGFAGFSKEQIARARMKPTSKGVVDKGTGLEYRIGILAHYLPAEKITDADLDHYFAFESEDEPRRLLKIPRASPDSWHPLDELIFLIQDRTGKVVGVIYTDNPVDGKLPKRETIEMIEVFVSLVAIALENAGLYSDAVKARDEVQVLNRLMFHDLMNYSMAIRGYLDLAASQPDDSGIEK